MTTGAHFGCGPDHEALAAELAELVHGSWELTAGVQDVMIMPNGARVLASFPDSPRTQRSPGGTDRSPPPSPPRDVERKCASSISGTDMRIDSP